MPKSTKKISKPCYFFCKTEIETTSESTTKIKEYLAILRPLKIQRNALVRIGGENDGGYVMCRPLLKMGGGK